MSKLKRTLETHYFARNRKTMISRYRFQGGGGTDLPTEREIESDLTIERC